MQTEVNILLGVSGESAARFLSLLIENEQTRYNVEQAEMKETFLHKANKAQHQVYIVTVEFINSCFPDFISYSNVRHAAVPKILLCAETDFEAAVQLLHTGFKDCLLLSSLTAEKIEKSINHCLQHKQIISLVNDNSGTDHLQTKQDLQKFYERFVRISSTTNDAVWEWNLAENSLWANENHQHLYGLAITDPVPSKEEWVERIHPADRQRLLDTQENALASDTNVFISEYRFKTKKGYKYIFDRCYIERDSNGKPVLMTGSMMDITERKEAEEKIIHSNERFELIARTTNEALWEMDLVTGYNWSNERHK